MTRKVTGLHAILNIGTYIRLGTQMDSLKLTDFMKSFFLGTYILFYNCSTFQKYPHDNYY